MRDIEKKVRITGTLPKSAVDAMKKNGTRLGKGGIVKGKGNTLNNLVDDIEIISERKAKKNGANGSTKGSAGSSGKSILADIFTQIATEVIIEVAIPYAAAKGSQFIEEKAVPFLVDKKKELSENHRQKQIISNYNKSLENSNKGNLLSNGKQMVDSSIGKIKAKGNAQMQALGSLFNNEKQSYQNNSVSKEDIIHEEYSKIIDYLLNVIKKFLRPDFNFIDIEAELRIQLDHIASFLIRAKDSYDNCLPEDLLEYQKILTNTSFLFAMIVHEFSVEYFNSHGNKPTSFDYWQSTLKSVATETFINKTEQLLSNDYPLLEKEVASRMNLGAFAPGTPSGVAQGRLFHNLLQPEYLDESKLFSVINNS